MKKLNITKWTFTALLVITAAFTSCKKDSNTGDEEKREEQKNEIARKQAILDKLSGKTYTLVVIENATTGENLMASTMFPACIADDTFALSNSTSIDLDYGTALCESTSRVYKGNYGFKSMDADSIKFTGMDEAPAYAVKKIRKQDVFMVKSFDPTLKTMVLSYKLANSNEVVRKYTFK